MTKLLNREWADDGSETERECPDGPKLIVGLGRGNVGKSVGLAEIGWRAEHFGRPVVIADGDPKTPVLSRLIPRHVTAPETAEYPKVKAWLELLGNRLAEERASMLLDLGGGDMNLEQFHRKLDLVEFIEAFGGAATAIYFMGPDLCDLEHAHAIFATGHFRPRQTILVLNEGVTRDGKATDDAFDPLLNDSRFTEMVAEGAAWLIQRRLDCMDAVLRLGINIYDIQDRAKAPGFGPIQQFQVRTWLRDLNAQRVEKGVDRWLP
jgi:hypothetical protein